MPDHASIPEHDRAAGIADHERLPRLDTRELEDRALDTCRLRLVEEPVGAHREEVVRVSPRPRLPIRVVVMEEERRRQVTFADAKVSDARVVAGHVDPEPAIVEAEVIVVGVVVPADHGRADRDGSEGEGEQHAEGNCGETPLQMMRRHREARTLTHGSALLGATPDRSSRPRTTRASATGGHRRTRLSSRRRHAASGRVRGCPWNARAPAAEWHPFTTRRTIARS